MAYQRESLTAGASQRKFQASKEVCVLKEEPFKGELPFGMNDPRKRALLISKIDHFSFKTIETNAGHVLVED